MGHSSLIPFSNESDSQIIAGFTVENRCDRVSIYGNTDITRDQEGLKKAIEMQLLLGKIIDELAGTKDLPTQISNDIEVTEANPFKKL